MHLIIIHLDQFYPLYMMTMFELPQLPFEETALLPVINEETLDYHYGKHHKAYVDKLNALVPGTAFEGKSLEEIIKTAELGAIFNNAAQVWNHTFYWNCLRAPREGNQPSGALLEAINQTFDSFENFLEQMGTAAVNNFGSGWTWLVKNAEGKLEILNTSNAGNPLTQGLHPLLTIDVWEHAYYIQHRNARPAYVQSLFSLINWDFVEKNYSR